jgi:uncharacterized protein
MLRSRFSLFFIPLFTIVMLLGHDGPPDNSIHIVKKPSEAMLASENVYTWNTWEKEPSTFPWQFKEKEKVYVLAGKVHITHEGSDQVYVLKKGDYAEFAAGLRCIWEVKEPFKKHVTLEKNMLGNIYWTIVFKIQSAGRKIKKTLTNTNDSQTRL